MATSNPAVVKCLNTGPGRKRFVFKSFSQRVGEINIAVFRSLDTVKTEPSVGSSFFRECLIQWRELNTAEDFITFYERMMPLVQTLPQIILHREKIFSELIIRLKLRARLSLEPILMLIAALSRDILKDFVPFLERLTKAIVDLLEEGGERDPEILEQVFISWSYIMMYLQKYLVEDTISILKVTVQLRFFAKDYVREFMAEVVSFLLRNAPINQLLTGLRKAVLEVAKRPSPIRKDGVTALLYHVMKGPSERLHSRAEKVLRFLLDKSTLCLTDKYPAGSSSVVEVATGVLNRLCSEVEQIDLGLMYTCLFDGIKSSVKTGSLDHVNCLITLLSFAVGCTARSKSLDREGILNIVELLIDKFIGPCDEMKMEEELSRVIESLLNLLICILDVNLITSDLLRVTSLYAPLFKLRTPSLLNFIKELVMKNPQISYHFHGYIISSIANFLENSPELSTFILLKYFEIETMPPHCHEKINTETLEAKTKIRDFFNGKLCHWTDSLNNISHGEVSKNEASLLWGIIICFPKFCNSKEGSVVLRNLISNLDKLLETKTDIIADLPKSTWQSVIGAALSSYNELISLTDQKSNEVGFFLSLAERNKSSPKILCAVSELLSEKSIQEEITNGNDLDILSAFTSNLSNSNKDIRVSTLKILSHIFSSESNEEQRPNKRLKSEDSSSAIEDPKSTSVAELFLSIETTALSVETSRKITNTISRIQTHLSSGKIRVEHLQLVLHGTLGVLHNRFSDVWDPALELLSVLVRNHRDSLWEKFVDYFVSSQTRALSREDASVQMDSVVCEQTGELVECFEDFLNEENDPTPCATVMVLLLKSLQKISDIAESRSRQLVPLFFKFLGYNNDNIKSIESYSYDQCKGKDWRIILKEWLNLMKSMHDAKSLYRSNVLREVLIKRLLDDAEPDVQVKVLECLLNWKEEFLVPYYSHLRNIAASESVREELTTWSVSKESCSIQAGHRAHSVPLIIRLLTPKVRNLKSLGSRKHAGISHRKGLIRFLMQFEPEELELFFSLLLKPLLFDLEKPLDSILPEVSTFIATNKLSWKRVNGFLHVIEDVFATFDTAHIGRFLDPLMMIIALILENCMKNIKNENSMEIDHPSDDVEVNGSTKLFKELRTLCLRIISLSLNKYEAFDFSSEFWDLFFKSVKPMIDSFKLEGASSEKPSSLFSCFLAMSKNPRLVTLLGRQANLVPTIFSILSVSTASSAITSSVLEFVENLLRLDLDLDSDESEENVVKEVLLPHIDSLVQNLHDLYRIRIEFQRKSVILTGHRELRIFKMLVNYIKDPNVAGYFLDILLPFFKKKEKNSDECMDGLRVVEGMVPILDFEAFNKVFGAINPLLVNAGLELRLCICEIINGLASRDSSLTTLARVMQELNAVSSTEIGELDYDIRIKAYDSIGAELFAQLREEQAMTILSHCVYDMASDELIFRQSASRALQSFLQFATPILNGEDGSTGEDGDTAKSWKKVSMMQVIDRIYLHHMGNAMSKDVSIQKEWFVLLREMVHNFQKHPSLSSFNSLCSDDPDHDFFINIVHLQIYRRAKALSVFRKKIAIGNFSEAVIMKIFVPLVFNMLFEIKEIKAEHVKNSCVETLASISAHVQWDSYRAILTKCFKELTQKPNSQKIILRLICGVLDSFHFFDSSSTTVQKLAEKNKHFYLEKVALPQARKLLSHDSEKVNVNISLVCLKLLKLLPAEIMEAQLSSIVHRICTFLKNRLESMRDEARSALAACLKELGIEYLLFIVKIMRSILKRGYELHVLGYTLHFLLSKVLGLTDTVKTGTIDYCLSELLEVVDADIFGDVSEEKEVDKIASKMKETKKSLSYETLRLVSKNVTFKTRASDLLSPVCARFTKHLPPKLKGRIETALQNISLGLESNQSTETSELLVFVFGLVQDSTKQGGVCESNSNLNLNSNSNSHLITNFALGLLCSRLKKLKLEKRDLELLSMLDPFIPLLTQCLNSKYENVISSSFKCLSHLIMLPLPSLDSNAEKIKNSLLEISRRSSNSTTTLMRSCLKLLSVLLNNSRVRVSISDEELRMIVNFPVFIDIQTNPSPVALSLLKAIIGRKLVVPEIYDLVSRVGELMVTSQDKPVRTQSSQILLQFLLDYRLSEKRLQQHLDFLLSNLSYEHSSGKEAVLEMLHTILMKFPKSIIDNQAQNFFIHLVAALSNDKDTQIHNMVAIIIKELIERTSDNVLNSILEFCVSWYTGHNQNLWSSAAQVLGLMQEAKKGFGKHMETILGVARRIMESALGTNGTSGTENEAQVISGALDEITIPFWKEAYYSVAMLEKIFSHLPELYFKRELEDIWILVTKCLVHPYIRLREISTRVISSYFTSVPEFKKENKSKNKKNKLDDQSFILLNPSRLFVLSVSLINQLRTDLERGTETNNLIVQNIPFLVCELDSFARERKLVQFWTDLVSNDKSSYIEGFELLGSQKAKNNFFLGVTSNHIETSEQDLRSLLVVPLVKRMAKISMQMGDVQTEIVFKSFGAIATKLGHDETLIYAHQILFPLYKVCEGFAGKVITDEMKQLAGEVRDKIRDIIGVDNFVQVYNQIRKSLKGKREKRKKTQKVLAVVNPMRHAKKKLRVAAKHKVHKRKKMLAMKLGKWKR